MLIVLFIAGLIWLATPLRHEYVQLGEAKSNNGKYLAAAKFYIIASELYEESSRKSLYHQLASTAYLNAKAYSDALDHSIQAIVLNPQDNEASQALKKIINEGKSEIDLIKLEKKISENALLDGGEKTEILDYIENQKL